MEEVYAKRQVGRAAACVRQVMQRYQRTAVHSIFVSLSGPRPPLSNAVTLAINTVRS